MQDNNNYNNQAYYADTYSSGDSSGSGSVNLLEVGLIIFCIILLIIVSLWGFFSQSGRIRDKQRNFEISQIVLALDNFYFNSNTFPAARTYPIAQCSGRLNEVDFEWTLKEYLTGKKPQIDNHAYIKAENFPKDPWGIYSESPSQRKTKLLDCPKLFSKIDNDSKSVYQDETLSCNFSQTAGKYRKCYLYTSSTNGDKYEISYYSEDLGAFVIYSRLREDKLMTEIQKV